MGIQYKTICDAVRSLISLCASSLISLCASSLSSVQSQPSRLTSALGVTLRSNPAQPKITGNLSFITPGDMG